MKTFDLGLGGVATSTPTDSSSLTRRFEELTKKRDTLKQEEATLKAQKEVQLAEYNKYLSRLKEEFNVDTLEQAKELLATSTQKLDTLITNIETELNKYDV